MLLDFKKKGFIGCALFLIIVVLIYQINNFGPGLSLTLMLILYVFLAKEFRESYLLIIIILFSIFIRTVLSFYNTQVKMLSFAANDALRFQQKAEDYFYNSDLHSLPSIGSEFYSYLLSIVYKLTDLSWFTGQQISVLFFILTLQVILKIKNKLNIKNKKIGLITVTIFSFSPVSIIYSSLTMREIYQIFLLMCIFSLLIDFLDKYMIRKYILIIICSIMLGLFHNGLMPYVFILIVIVSLTYVKIIQSLFLKYFLYIVFAVTCTTLLWFLKDSTSAFTALTSGQVFEYLNNYREAANESRATYTVPTFDLGIIGVIVNLPLYFLFYMLTPFPWDISSIFDVYAFVETIFRLMLFWNIFYLLTYIKKEDSKNKSIYIIVILVIILELLWALGTKNWGTALRHHLVVSPITILLGVYGYYRIDNWGRKT
jgi:hypothetical protein